MTAIPFHRYADIFPLIEGAEFDAFVEDIRQNGVRDPIFIFEGAILEGRNRYRALTRLFESGAPLGAGWGVWADAPMPDHVLDIAAIQHPFRRFIPSEQGDPLDFVESKNIHRRNLTPSQRAACAAEIEVFRHGGQRAIPPEQAANLQLEPPSETPPEPAPPSRPAETRAELAQRYDVSERSIADAAKVRDAGADELKQAVKQGEVAVDAAATIAENLPKADQVALLEQLPRDEKGELLPESARVVRKLAGELREKKNEEKKQRREAREREQGAMQLALPDKKYGVIVEDPEWDFTVYSRDTGMDRHAANHYATSPDAALEARNVIDLAADDCVYALWTADLARGLDLLRTRGFAFKSYFVWVKDVVDQPIDPATLHALKLPEGRYLRVCGAPGTGFWNRDRDELLLIGVKGNPPCPAMGTQGESVWFAARPHVEGSEKDKHSAKPDICFDWFDAHFPSFRKIELNARQARPGWDAWGLEAPQHQEPGQPMADVGDDEGDADAPPFGWDLQTQSESETDTAADAAAEAENEAREAAGRANA